MRNAVKVVVFLCSLILVSTQSAQAISSQDFSLTDDPLSTNARTEALKIQREAAEKDRREAEKKAEEKRQQEQLAAEAAKQPPTHIVKSGESLTAIAEQYGLSWQRLFNKNTQIADPNTLTVSEAITIPHADEQLTERAIPQATPAITSSPNVVVGSIPRGSSDGNTYTAGYCTWYAKNRRPDLPNRLGDAAAWVSSAAARGIPTGSTPQVGAIGQQGNHVVYVESVNGDGTVTISEMNYHGRFIISSRTVSASLFRYIY